jgi:hypothetical protein
MKKLYSTKNLKSIDKEIAQKDKENEVMKEKVKEIKTSYDLTKTQKRNCKRGNI